MGSDLYINGKLVGTATNVQMPVMHNNNLPNDDIKPSCVRKSVNVDIDLSVDSGAVKELYDRLVAQEQGEL